MRYLYAALAVLCLVLLATTAWAHRVNVFAWVEGDKIHMESEFSRGNPVREGTVEVHNAATGDVLLKGTTDDTGVFVFPIPESAQKNPVDLEIVLQAGEGHRSSWTVRAKEYAGAAAPVAVSAPAAVTESAQESSGAQPHAQSAPVDAAAGSPALAQDPAAMEALEARLEAALDKKLDEKISPLVRAVNRMEMDAGPKLSDIFGGIGYLFGLAGLLAYAKSRKKQ